MLRELFTKHSREIEVNAIDSRYRTALHYAAEKGYFKIVDLLLENGANVKPRDNERQTALDLAKSTIEL